MRIERIVKKNRKDVTVQLDNSESLILSLEVFLKSGLKKNDEISEDRFSSLITENIKYHVRQRALRLLARRQYSRVELKLKLLQKDYQPKLIEDALNELSDKGILDDHKFASVFIEEKLRTKNWGKRKLKSELIKKGVHEKIISKVLCELLAETDLSVNAQTIAIKKLKSLKYRNYDKKTLKQKISSFLVARGYDFEIVNEITNNLLGGQFQDD
ncbi:MAG TPA: regulatory protein RecX [Ignavibacteriaceae bacterium]